MGEHLGMHAVVLDGEVVAFGEDGRPSFARLQNRLHLSDPKEARRRAAADPVHFVAFDVLYADGRSLMTDPYDARRARLEQFEFSGANFTTTECFRDVSGRDVLRATTENGLEGVVAKRRNSTYRPGRRVAEWVKVKVVNTQEVVIGGWTDGKGGRGASLGSCCSESPGRTAWTTWARSAPASTTGPSSRSWSSCELFAPGPIPSSAPSPKPRPRVRTSSVPAWSARWRTENGPLPAACATRPGVACVPTRRRPTSGASQSPRPDAPDDDPPAPGSGTHGRRQESKNGSQRVRVGDRELSVTNLDKVLFPETGFTKGQLIDYYARIAPVMLPHLVGSPPHHEALSRRGRGQVLLREARALAHPPLGEDG